MTERLKIVKTYEFRNRPLGSVMVGEDGKRLFQPTMGTQDLFTLVNEEMGPEHRIHLRSEAYGVYRALQALQCNPDDFVSDEDIAIYVMQLGAHSLTQLYRKDHRAWELVKQRNLASIIFQEQDVPVSDVLLDEGDYEELL